MLLEKIEEDLGSTNKLLKKNKINEITNYLKDNIFKYGSTYNINELSNRLLNKALDSESLVKYLKKKYE